MSQNVCECLAYYGLLVDCTCSQDDEDEVSASMDVEALQAAGVCIHCGNIEEECECHF